MLDDEGELGINEFLFMRTRFATAVEGEGVETCCCCSFTITVVVIPPPLLV